MMERLTGYESIGGHAHAIPMVTDDQKVVSRLAAYEDTGLTPEEVLPKKMADEIAMKLLRLADLESFAPYKRLRELAEADKEGRVVVLPCNPGGCNCREERHD